MFASIQTLACGPYNRMYLARNYYMFRVMGEDMEGKSFLWDKVEREENCQLWAKLTSTRIPLTDIEEVVYRWSLPQMRELQEMTRKQQPNTNNAFARWIVEHRNSEIADFLVLAKRCETVRAEQVDPWYYAVDGDEVEMELKDILSEAQAYKGKLLRDRYALQMMRVLTSLHQQEVCEKTWKAYASDFKDDVIKRLAGEYVGVPSDRKPNSQVALCDLQHHIHSVERWESPDWENPKKDERDITEYKMIYAHIQQTIKDKTFDDLTPWYYAGAFVADKLGKRSDANRYLGLAKAAKSQGDLPDAIHVLDIYLKVKYAERYTQKLEDELLGELRWLDGMIVNKLDADSRRQIEYHGFVNHNKGISQYYWNDMMRKIVIGELAPLCIRSDNKTRALQYLNMADNRIFNLVGIVTLADHFEINEENKWFELPDTTLSVTAFRQSKDFYIYDYSNDYFLNIDSLGVAHLKQLANRLSHPSCALDSFLLPRSYADPQYLNEIIGTQQIANMQYDEAVTYLEKVTDKFNRSRNVYQYCVWDPFTGKKYSHPDSQYKLKFARRMAALERDISCTKDPNDKAEYMLDYAMGLMSSVGEYCWPLTTYYWGCWYSYPFFSQYQRRMVDCIKMKTERVKKQAFALFTDDERAANAYYEWKMFKTVATKYKHTQKAAFVRSHCDKLCDYKVTPALQTRIWREIE